MEIYNEAVRDLLSTDGAPLRLLDDPEVSLLPYFSCSVRDFVVSSILNSYEYLHLKQKGTVVEKLTEETLTEWSDLQTLLSICAGIGV